jgi:hypothetical protein
MPEFTEADMRARSPYLWQYPMALDTYLRNLGEWSCDRLVGQPSVHNGDPTVQRTKRNFGIILDSQDPGFKPDATPIKAAIKACGDDDPVSEYDFNGNSADGAATTAVANLHNAGVTTIFCLCAFGTDAQYAAAANQDGYFPEWLTGSYFFHQDNTYGMQGWLASERANALGISVVPREVKWADNPVLWALAGGNPGGNWSPGGEPPPNTIETALLDEYHSWLLLFSGIQEAGPNLTPETFQKGLQKTVFPNPDTPIMAGHVGFGGGSHAMTLDATEYWYNNAATDHNPSANGSGAICYVQGGIRRSLGTWIKGPDPFFQTTCDSGGYPGQP